MPQIFISLPWLWPLTLTNTVKLNYSSVCLHPAYACGRADINQFRLSNYLCMYNRSYLTVV